MTVRSRRDWVVDGLFFSLGVGFTLLAVFDSVDHAPVEIVMGGAGCLGLWVRRRWPVGFAVVAPIVAGHALAAFVSLWVRPDIAVTHWSQAALGIVCHGDARMGDVRSCPPAVAA